MNTVELGQLNPNVLPLDAIVLTGNQTSAERLISLKAPWKFDGESVSYPVSGFVSGRGWWVRFADGTQITFGSIRPVSNNNSGTTYTYPVAFYAAPRVFTNAIGVVSAGLGGSYVCEHGTPNVNTVTVKVLAHAAAAVNDAANIEIEIIAIGRWKA